MGTELLRITQLTKHYAGVRVLDGVDLSIREGECMVLAGLNGAGKSTLLHCLLDFVRPDGGDIRIAGLPHHQPAARARLAYLPERFTPPPFLTGYAFLRHTLALHKQPWNRHEADAFYRQKGLDPAVLDRKVSTYSKGMAQQLGLAACLLVRPALLVLDEPMSGLDPEAAFGIRESLREARSRGVAALFTSHDLRDLDAICDRAAILQSGRLRTIEREQIAAESLFVHHAIQ